MHYYEITNALSLFFLTIPEIMCFKHIAVSPTVIWNIAIVTHNFELGFHLALADQYAAKRLKAVISDA